MKILVPVIVILSATGCGDNNTGDLGPVGDPTDPQIAVGGEHDLMPLPPELWFHPDGGGGFVANAPLHDARYESGALSLDGHYANGDRCSTPLGIFTSSVSLGSMPYPNTIISATVNYRGELLLARASFIEKFTNTFFGVEQSWTIPSKPESLDLAVRVAVTGHEFVGSSSLGLHFAPPGDFGSTYSIAVWRDANGIETTIVPTFESGEIVLRIPADLVGSSTYPVVLDPQIDLSETPVDQPVSNVPTGANATNSAVGSDGVNFLTVWRDDRNGTDSDIFGMILSTTGGYSTNNGFLISKSAAGAVAPGVQSNPTVAFVNGSYLVVWQDFKSPASDADLVAARVSTTGTVTVLGSVALTSAQETAPRIAVRGTQALIVFQSGSGVAARLYDGIAFTGGVIPIAATGAEPAAAADPAGNYLVTYTDTASTNLFGQFVTSAGVVDPTQHTISDGQGAQELSSAVFAGGHYIVAWQNNRNGRKLFAARFDSTGGTTDTHTELVAGVTTTFNGVQLGTSALVQQGTVPGLVCGSTTCAITWSDRRTFAATGQDIFVLRFALDLTGQTEISVSTESGDQKQPKIGIAPNAPVAGGRLLVVWEDLRNGSPSQISAARIDGTTVLESAPASKIVVSVGANSESSAAVTRIPGANQNWLIAWSDSRGSTGSDIQGTLVNDAATPAALTNPVSNAPGHQGAPAVAGTTAANGHLVVWTDGRSDDIRGSRVSATGAVLDTGDGIDISTFANQQQRPAVASNGANHYLVVWQDRGQAIAAGSATRGFDIYGAVIDATSGAVLKREIPISIADGDQQAPSVSFDSVAKQFVVVWQDGRNGANERDIFAARVTDLGATSSTIDSTGVQVSVGAGSQLTPKITFGSDRSIAVWEDRRSGVPHIFGARLQISGAVAGLGGTLNVLDPNGIGITSAAAGAQQRPAVAFVSTTEFAPVGTQVSVGAFAVVWDDNRSNTNLDIFGSVVFQQDGNVGSEFPIAISTDIEAAPAIGPGGPAQANGSVRMLVSYTRLNSAISAQRVVMRRVTFGSQSFNCETTTCMQSCNNNNTSCDVNCAGSQSCTTDCNNLSACLVNCEDVGVGFAAPNSCTTTCNNGSTCSIDCRGASHCAATCNGGSGSSTCDINCNDSGTGDCNTITCGKNDLCTLRCVPGPAGQANADADCGFFSCVQGTVVDCNFIPLANSPQGAREPVNSTTVTYKTTAAHGFIAGQSVIVTGVPTAGFNGTFTIASVPDTTSFTVSGMPAGLGNSGGGHVSPSTATGAKVCHAACPASN